jgi:hypothetical protein
VIDSPSVLLRLRRSHVRLATGVTAAAGVATGIALAPRTVVFACTCNCPGGPPPTVPEAPWVPLVLIVGAVVALLARRGRRGGPPGPRGSSGGFRPRLSLHGKAIAGHVAKIVCAGTIAIVGLGALSTVSATTTSAASNAGCSTPTPDPTSGTQGIISVPDAGAASAPEPVGPRKVVVSAGG